MQSGLLYYRIPLALDKIVDCVIDSGFKLASYVCIISVISTLNHYISSVVLQARIYFNLELSTEKQSMEIFTTKR